MFATLRRWLGRVTRRGSGTPRSVDNPARPPEKHISMKVVTTHVDGDSPTLEIRERDCPLKLVEPLVRDNFPLLTLAPKQWGERVAVASNGGDVNAIINLVAAGLDPGQIAGRLRITTPEVVEALRLGVALGTDESPIGTRSGPSPAKVVIPAWPDIGAMLLGDGTGHGAEKVRVKRAPHPTDTERIVRAMRAAGYLVTPEQADDLWRKYSRSVGTPWLFMVGIKGAGIVERLMPWIEVEDE